VATFTPEGRLGRLRLRGADLSESIASAVIGAPTLDLTASEVSQLVFSARDDGFELLESGLFAKRTRIDYLDLAFEIAAVELNDADGKPVVTITARSRGAQVMRRTKGARVWRGQSPTQVMEQRAKAAGLAFVGEPSAERAQIARLAPKGEKPENDWDLGARLARELGYITFEAAEVLYFARPTWLVKRAKTLELRWPRADERGEVVPDRIPSCRRSTDAGEGRAVTVTAEVPFELADNYRPGQVLGLKGIPTFNGDYLITSIRTSLDSTTPVTIDAQTPIDPEPEPPDRPNDDRGVEGGAGAPGSPSGSGSGAWIWPVAGTITGDFGENRGDHTHTGIDIATANGTRIVASRAGTVRFVGWSGGYGNLVIVVHGDGLESYYAHQLRFGCRVGQRLEQGQVLGFVDSTGNSTGPHLHFETRRGGVPFDPASVLP
jgi:murein DD-endopeptidase MepM/ murein hydrolase activator NlpD